MNATFVFKNLKTDEHTVIALFTQYFDVPVFIKFVYSTKSRALMKIDPASPLPSYHFYDVVISLDKAISPDFGADYVYSEIEGIDAETMSMHILKAFLKQAALKALDTKLELNF